MAKRVMIVEDNELNTKLFHDLLEARGYDILQTRDGMEALKMARSEKPDLILMDVVMPKVNGFQATRKLSRDERTKHIPIIIVTSKDQKTDIMWGKRQGAQDYLIKPADEKQLLSTVSRLLMAASA